MIVTLVLLFVIGYIAIAFEHPLGLNKAAPALITGVLCWLGYFLNAESAAVANTELVHHVGEISSILFFLLGAMTIVEVIDSHDGFRIITDRIRTRSMVKLLFIISLLTFFLSALLDNLTTAIVMTSLCSKILHNKEDRLKFVGVIVIAANTGGAWSPIGDVTTTMLWIGGQVTTATIISRTLLPSMIGCLLPVLLVAYTFKGKTVQPPNQAVASHPEIAAGRNFIFFSSIVLLIGVPVFKTITHMPPFMGMLLALAIMGIITTVVHRKKEEKRRYSVANALQKVDTPSILFFLGILLAVGALQSSGVLNNLAGVLDDTLQNEYALGVALGALSAVVDNVPLVAATQGMYGLSHFPTDHTFWTFLALTTGTGGSMIIIGSAAGVAAMGMEDIKFMWYLKKIGWLALVGFVAGIATYLLQEAITR